jgi:hypothetical protein
MKKILLVMAALLLVAPAFAGNTKAGIKAGLAMYNMTASYEGESESGDMKMGLQAGGFVGIMMNQGKMAIQPELLFVMKGAQEDIGDETGKMNLNYIQIPVLLKVILGESKTKFNVFAGPAMSLLMSANASAGGESVDIKDAYNSSEFGVVAGLGVDIDKICLEFRADLGLANIAADAPDDLSVKNSGFGLLVGYAFN